MSRIDLNLGPWSAPRAHMKYLQLMFLFRCRRVVILLSRAFLESPVCDFQLKFAQCLAPGEDLEAHLSLTLVDLLKILDKHASHGIIPYSFIYD